MKIEATVFMPASIEKQVEQASFGVEVELIKSVPYKNGNGFIYTRQDFQVHESFGESLDYLSLDLPGGVIGEVGTAVDGSPQFKKGMRYFLLIKEIENKYYLSNFTLGQYEIQKIGNQTYYVSTVFPFDKEIGRVKKEKFIEIMNSKWNLVSVKETSLTVEKNVVKKIVHSKANGKDEKNNSRDLASTSDVVDFEKWIIYFLCFICASISFSFLRRRWNEK